MMKVHEFIEKEIEMRDAMFELLSDLIVVPIITDWKTQKSCFKHGDIVRSSGVLHRVVDVGGVQGLRIAALLPNKGYQMSGMPECCRYEPDRCLP